MSLMQDMAQSIVNRLVSEHNIKCMFALMTHTDEIATEEYYK